MQVKTHSEIVAHLQDEIQAEMASSALAFFPAIPNLCSTYVDIMRNGAACVALTNYPDSAVKELLAGRLGTDAPGDEDYQCIVDDIEHFDELLTEWLTPGDMTALPTPEQLASIEVWLRLDPVVNSTQLAQFLNLYSDGFSMLSIDPQDVGLLVPEELQTPVHAIYRMLRSE